MGAGEHEAEVRDEGHEPTFREALAGGTDGSRNFNGGNLEGPACLRIGQGRRCCGMPAQPCATAGDRGMHEHAVIRIDGSKLRHWGAF